MGIRRLIETRTARLSVVDLALVKLSCIAAGVWLAHTVPALQRVDRRLLFGVSVALAAKPALTVLGGSGPGCCGKPDAG